MNKIAMAPMGIQREKFSINTLLANRVFTINGKARSMKVIAAEITMAQRRYVADIIFAFEAVDGGIETVLLHRLLRRSVAYSAETAPA